MRKFNLNEMNYNSQRYLIILNLVYNSYYSIIGDCQFVSYSAVDEFVIVMVEWPFIVSDLRC